MKKLIAIFCLGIYSVLAFAGDGIKVTNGKATFLKEEATAEIVFCWKGAKWDNSQSLKEHYGTAYDAQVKAAETSFLTGFNDKSKKVSAKSNDASAKYQIKIEITNLDKFYNVMSFIPGFTHKVWANVKVVEKASGSVVCEAVVEEFEEGRDFTEDDSLKKVFVEFGGKIARLK